MKGKNKGGGKRQKKADAARAGTFDLQICIHCAEHVKC